MSRCLTSPRRWGGLKVSPGVIWSILPTPVAMTMVACNLFAHSSKPQDPWPAPYPTRAGAPLAARAREEYRRARYDPRRNFVTPYVATGDFLRFGVTRLFRPGPRVRFDSLGLPMVRYDTTY